MTPDPNLIKELHDLFAYMDDEVQEVSIRQPKHKLEGETAADSRELGVLSLTEGDVESALKHFRRGIDQRTESDPQGYEDLAGAFEYADMEAEAVTEYNRALEMGGSPEARAALSSLARRYGRFSEAIRQLEEAVRIEPEVPFLHFKLAETLREAGMPTRAYAAARRATELDPKQPLYYYWIGDLLIAMGRFDEALSFLRTAVELSPGDDYLLLRTAVAFWGAGMQIEAIRAVRLAAELDPSKALYHGLVQVLLETNGQAEDAAAEQEKASKMDPYDRDFLARILAEMKLG